MSSHHHPTRHFSSHGSSSVGRRTPARRDVIVEGVVVSFVTRSIERQAVTVR